MTDNSGKNNIFVQLYLLSHPSSARVALGIGLGVGIPLLIAICLLTALLRQRKRARQCTAENQPTEEKTAIGAENMTSIKNEAIS